MKAATAEELRENVARRGNSLDGRASDTDSEGLLHSTLPKRKPAQQRILNLQICRRPAIGSGILGSSARSKVLSTALDRLRSSFLACATNCLPKFPIRSLGSSRVYNPCPCKTMQLAPQRGPSMKTLAARPAARALRCSNQDRARRTPFPEIDELPPIGCDCTLRLREYDIFFRSPEPAGLYRGYSGTARPFLVRR